MKIEEIAKYLNLHIAVVTGFARAGFFGFSSKSGHYKNKAIQDFKKYGLQWDTSLKKRVLPAHINPVVSGWENPPLHTLSQYQVSVDKDMDAIENTYWVANFFFIPNYFYFPDTDRFCLLEAPKVKLKEKFVFSSDENKKVIVYPDPNDNLALIQVSGKIEDNTDETLFSIAKNTIVPVLNWLSYTTDHILPIVQQNLVKLPSGDTYFYKAKQAPLVQLNPSSFTEHKSLRDAMSLYRLGLNSNEPIYAFLSFFRAKEAVEKIKKEWFTKYKEQFKEHQDFINLINNFNKHLLPKHPVFGDFSEKKFTYTLNKLEDRYRNAIAHAHNDKKEIDVYLLTGSDESANISLQYSLSSIRFIIKVQINSLNEIFNFVKNAEFIFKHKIITPENYIEEMS